MTIHSATTYLAGVPPLAIAVLLALTYAAVARGRVSWPMLGDAALLALYLWRPSPALLLLVLFLGAVRHVPVLAREVVVLFRLHEFDGWTTRLVMFALPALKVYASQVQHETQAAANLPPMVAPQSAPMPVAALPLMLNEGLRALNGDPTAPHVGVIGATRLGKTTFVGVLLSYRVGELVIATPKAEKYDPWFGADVARPTIDLSGGAVDYTPIEQAVSSVHQEMLRRNTPGSGGDTPITLVVDEWTQVVSELPGLAKKVINLLRMGAGCGIRLILMATDVNVRGWKMDGSAGVLDNLVFARVEDGRKWSIARLDANWRMVSPRPLDTGQVQGLAGRVSLAGRGWRGVGGRVGVGQGVPTDAGPLRASLGGGAGVPGASGDGVPGGGGGVLPPDLAVGTVPGTGTGNGTPIAVLRALRSSGMTRERAREIGCVFRDTDWTEAGK